MSDVIARLAAHVALLAETCSRTTVGFSEIIEAQNKRIAALEAQVAGMSVGINVAAPVKPGCVCPPNAERTCKGYGCPRIPQDMGPGPKVLVF